MAISDKIAIYLDATYEAMNVTVQKIKYEETSFTPNPAVGVIDFDKDDITDPAPPKIPASNLAIRLGVRIPLF